MPDRVPRYDEPWHRDSGGIVTKSHGNVVTGSGHKCGKDCTGGWGVWWDDARADRAVACVNALAGRRPEALTELEASLEVFVEHENDAIQKNRAMQRVIAALAAFRGESHAG